MKLRELVDIMNVTELAPLQFIPFDTKNSLPHFNYISPEKWKAYKNGALPSINENSDNVYVCMPDITVKELYIYAIMGSGRQSVINVIMQISYKFKIKADENEYSLIYAIYAILHEVGHYVYFRNLHMTDIEYGCLEKRDRFQYRAFLEKTKTLPHGYVKNQYLSELDRQYKAIPSEKAADEYAFLHIKEKYEWVIQYLKEQASNQKQGDN